MASNSKERRRKSDAKWRAHVASCYETLKLIIPVNKRASRRHISRAKILEESSKHIHFLESILSSLLEEKVRKEGCPVDERVDRVQNEVTAIKNSFTEGMPTKKHVTNNSRGRGRGRGRPADDRRQRIGRTGLMTSETITADIASESASNSIDESSTGFWMPSETVCNRESTFSETLLEANELGNQPSQTWSPSISEDCVFSNWTVSQERGQYTCSDAYTAINPRVLCPVKESRVASGPTATVSVPSATEWYEGEEEEEHHQSPELFCSEDISSGEDTLNLKQDEVDPLDCDDNDMKENDRMKDRQSPVFGQPPHSDCDHDKKGFSIFREHVSRLLCAKMAATGLDSALALDMVSSTDLSSLWQQLPSPKQLQFRKLAEELDNMGCTYSADDSELTEYLNELTKSLEICVEVPRVKSDES